jgi:hypothetical protein
VSTLRKRPVTRNGEMKLIKRSSYTSTPIGKKAVVFVTRNLGLFKFYRCGWFVSNII